MNSVEKKQEITLNSVVNASGELVSANLDGEVVILGYKSGAYYSLDQVGAFIWDLLQEPRAVSEVRDAMFEEYEIELSQCEQDLFALLEDLADKELIDVKNETAA
jgi:hypothetical protein